MMKKAIGVLVLVTMLVLTLGFASAESIKTSTISCGTQNANHYAIGEHVYIRGEGFDANTKYAWDITGQPGGASCDSNIVVASGDINSDADGYFCFDAYTILEGDCGEYKATADRNKHDNYRVDEGNPVVPEFGTVVGMLTALGALGVFFLVRRK
jgi:hypothetical protein